MADSVNMSLDEIIKQNRTSRNRGRGSGGSNRGNGRGGGRRGRGGRGRGGRSQSRSGTPGPGQGRSRSRSRSQGPGGRANSRGRSQSRARSRSRQRRSASRARSVSRSRSQLRKGLTPKGRAGLEEQFDMPSLGRGGRYMRGGKPNRLRRSYSNPNLQGGVHSRLGMTTRKGAGVILDRKPLAVAKRGISKRGRGFNTGNRYSSVGLRSDQILKEQRQNFIMQKNMIKSQTFRRSRNNSMSSASQLTVSVANDFAKKRRNSFGTTGYLDEHSLAQLNHEFGGGYNLRRGPGSVKSVGSNRSNRSLRSNPSNKSYNSTYSNRSNYTNVTRSTRARGRGRSGNRGIGRNFVNKQVLNPKLQTEIAVIQQKSSGGNSSNEAPSGVNLTPVPASTNQSLHQRFACT